MLEKMWFFFMGMGVFGIIFIVIKTILCHQKNNEPENTSDTNKCNVDFSDIRLELTALYTEIIDMDLKHSQTNKLTSHIYIIEHIIYRLENGDGNE